MFEKIVLNPKINTQTNIFQDCNACANVLAPSRANFIATKVRNIDYWLPYPIFCLFRATHKELPWANKSLKRNAARTERLCARSTNAILFFTVWLKPFFPAIRVPRRRRHDNRSVTRTVHKTRALIFSPLPLSLLRV